MFGDNSDYTASFSEIIGRGNFGVVHKAVLTTIDGTKTVAVKSLTGEILLYISPLTRMPIRKGILKSSRGLSATLCILRTYFMRNYD